MFDLKRYWSEVRAIERGLADCVWLSSIENPLKGQPGGRLAQAAAHTAARLLHAKSHRLATKEEIAAHLAGEEAKKKQERSDALRRRGVAVVSVKE
jgi:hypothetical protein